ncbi:hypothetical protein [Desulfonatronovibrio magnus]|uniref:hypothetical protein n=1 Tax=Desulfonatronovibrio magnus TaxID=698827 RepID=UPI0012FC38F6|nr:hypothetical protein [Desulfonatronovibrio magnus]
MIDHQCPQCGAPAVFKDTDKLFCCDYCRVRSILTSRDYFRYILPDSAPPDKDLIYFPYWRFRGCHFAVSRNSIDHKIVDVSNMATNAQDFPISLGLRTQTQRLKFMSSGINARFLKPDISLRNVLQGMIRRFNSRSKGPQHLNSFIGDNISMIYAPYYIENNILIDAILNRKATRIELFDLEKYSMDQPNWSVGFVPALCPSCGWDLDGRRDSIGFACHNCESMWVHNGRNFQGVSYACIEADENDNVVYLPFYRIDSEVSKIELSTFADLIKTANLPRVNRKEFENQPFYFWTPAFKIRPKELLGFATRLTLSQPVVQEKKAFPKLEPYPVTLSGMEVQGLLKLIIANFKNPSLAGDLGKIGIKAKEFRVVYLPFHARGRELYQYEYKLRLNANVLDYAKYL